MKTLAIALATVFIGGLSWYLAAPLFIDEVVDEQLPPAAIEKNAQQPTLVSKGAFAGADSFHKGSGSAEVFLLPDGSKLLRFEDFSVTNGPALSVYLSRDPAGTTGENFLDLGKLKGNMGNQNYVIPAGTDLSAYKSVLVHCVPFNVTFASAFLK